MSIKQMLKAIQCFAIMNTLEITEPSLEYVERLGYVVGLMNGDEKIFEQFSKFYENESICKTMINWIDARYLY